MTVKQISVWVLRVLVAAAFIAAALMKLIGVPRMVQEFGVIGLGQWFRIFTGCVELIGAGLLLWPAKSLWGAIVLLCICAGAFIAQIGPLHGDIIHVFVLAGLVALTLVLDRWRTS